MVKRALTPGTFDPITSGHMDVITRASRIMDEVIVAVAASDKKHPLFDLDERVSLVKQAVSHIPNVRVEPFDELLVDFARRMDAEVVIKGLRAITDFEYEFQMTAMNYQLDQELETTFIMSPPQYMYLSSSIVRESPRWEGRSTALFRIASKSRCGINFERNNGLIDDMDDIHRYVR